MRNKATCNTRGARYGALDAHGSKGRVIFAFSA